jgi:phosphoribosylformylglycinamidine (FGAM) synthase-like enzyme
VLHDVSVGGVAVALAEIAIKSNVGMSIEGVSGPDLFDETPLRFIVICKEDELSTDARHRRIGSVGGRDLNFGESGSITLIEATDVWRNAIPRHMDH